MEKVSLMEPMLPPSDLHDLEDLAVSLAEKSARTAAHIPHLVQDRISELVRSMNCYYSNLIEGHPTHPVDIERALAGNFSDKKEKRNLQTEAAAHIAVQRMIDLGQIPGSACSMEAVFWTHREFYERMPEDLRWVENPDTGERIQVVPGQMRSGDVAVGRHIPPRAESLSAFMGRFAEAYNPKTLSRMRGIVAVGAAHHRLLWIHPFYDGNGRVARLMSHAAFREYGVGNGLWSISRGLARRANDYKALLDAADAPREGDLDGRGSLSQKHLVAFCRFFLEVAIDQADYMSQVLDITRLLERMESYAMSEIRKKRLPKASHLLLREALLKGEVERGAVAAITGYSDRQARTIIAALVGRGLLGSNTAYGNVSLRFPHEVVEAYFPRLYPPLPDEDS